jgi:hypothetical protein
MMDFGIRISARKNRELVASYEERAEAEGQSAFALARTDYFDGKDLLSK